MAANQMELKAHEGTYSRFITLVKVGAAASAVVAAIVVLLIAN